ncbi:hypothetical protein GGS20DRAFT_424632 [Poronia punctata]|nr:hypothetical protein GGS20DRAFT_424632 [Poronia punctata]
MPLEHDKVLLPSLVDYIAESDPGRILYSVTKNKDPADGFDDISAQAFARAVDRCSWFIHRNLGPGKGFPTLVYLGPQDLSYPILVLASIKAGYKLLLVSPRNTLEAQLYLLDKTECNTFLVPSKSPLPAIKQVLAARPMNQLEIPEFRHFLDDDGGIWEYYPYTKTFSDAKAEPFAVLHTSGSTGLPKPIIQTHGTVSALRAFLDVIDPKTTFPAVSRGKRVYVIFPLFHCAGINISVAACIYAGFTSVLTPSPPSPDIVNSVHVHGNVQQECTVPTILEELVKVPEYVENLGRLEQVNYGGGPLPKTVGDLISTKTRILCCLGTTECGVFPSKMGDDPRDWPYLRMDPVLGYEYRQVAEGLYEQVIVRDENRLQYQGIFSTFPDEVEWPMKDLYTKHPDPEKGDYWLYRGRADDIIVFSTGEKLNPNDMEAIINANPVVKAALIAGLGRFQSSLLVEALDPPTNEEEKVRLLDTIWPSIEAANRESPSHGRIHRNMITFTSIDKPLPRAGKGTVQRRLALELYSSEIDSLYKSVEEPTEISNHQGGDWRHRSIGDAVKGIIASSSEIEVDSISSTTDLFELGLDSLQVNTIARKLNELLSAHGKPQSLTGRTVYSNPTIAALTEAVSVMIDGQGSSGGSPQETLEELLRLHTSELPITGRYAQEKTNAPTVVLLTGSTGSLGSYILESLQSDYDVAKIYCLCRGPDSLHRQKAAQAFKGLPPLSNKVECLDVDLARPYFGLSTESYKRLLGNVTHVIHNAWQVDFNLSIQSFTKHIGTVRRLIDFSAHSRFGAELFFISSISAVMGLQGEIREEVYEGWSTAEPTGYGQSKLLSERLLQAASLEANIPSAICRLGQVAGPTATIGMWPKKEWLPSLIASSKYLGKIPDSLGRLGSVDWIPVDKTAEAVVELAIHHRHQQQQQQPVTNAAVYHVVNPHRATWSELVPTVVKHLNQDREDKGIEVVPLETWVNSLRESASKSSEDIALNPATKLLDTYESLLGGGEGTFLATELARETSPTLSSIGPVRDEWMDNWMRQWAF